MNIELSQAQKKELLKIARNSIESELFRLKNNKTKPKYQYPSCGVFVTIKKEGSLRACVGRVDCWNSRLDKSVKEVAVIAAFGDFRFGALKKEEWELIKIEISVLSIPIKIRNYHDIELGKHGVIIKKGEKSGLFLPQVALETGWNLEEFLENLCQEKADLEKEAYKNPDTIIEVFEVIKFRE